MRAVDLIRRKRDGGELSREEIGFLVEGLTDGIVPTYQWAALAMASGQRASARATTTPACWHVQRR
jgi:thymidine phosphorylase